MKTSLFKKIKNSYLSTCRTVGAAITAPSRSQAQLMLFAIGLSLLALGTVNTLHAQAAGTVDDARLTAVMELLFGYIEGSFGALIMVAAGIGAIVGAAFGQYRAALGMLVVAVGAFILRSLVRTFFDVPQLAQ